MAERRRDWAYDGVGPGFAVALEPELEDFEEQESDENAYSQAALSLSALQFVSEKVVFRTEIGSFEQQIMQHERYLEYAVAVLNGLSMSP